jgi:hypothetical protein
MSRSGYTDDYGDDDPLALGRWRSAVNNAIRGKRGQAFLHDLAATLDAMPEKKLSANVWDEAVTAMAREIVYVNDEYGHYKTTPEKRWQIVRDWVRSNTRD